MRALISIVSAPPTRSKVFSCRNLQQLDLKRERQVADLVEEDRAALRRFQPPRFVLERSGERAPHVPEQLALEQMLAERGACDLDEGSVLARAEAMDVRGKHALAGAAFAGEQDRGVAVGDLGCQLGKLPALRPQRQQRQRLRQPLEPGAQRAILDAKVLQLDRARDHAANMLCRERLGNVIVCAMTHRLDRIGNRRVRRHHDHRQRRVEPLQFAEKTEAVHSRHPHVAQHQIRGRFGKQLERLLGAVRFGYAMPAGVEGRRDHAADVAIVVDDQDVSQSLPPAPGYPR